MVDTKYIVNVARVETVTTFQKDSLLNSVEECVHGNSYCCRSTHGSAFELVVDHVLKSAVVICKNAAKKVHKKGELVWR